jgi:glycerol-3-phosphate responsive antiterminator
MHTLINRVDFRDKIYVYLQSDDILTIPYTYTKKIQNATKKDLLNYRLIGGGIGIHFEKIDEDISLSGIISYKLNNELQAS